MPEEKTFMGHPIGLFYLFFVELWERFSYYGMRALLVLYIVDEFFLDMAIEDRKMLAFGIFGAYGSLVYATPIIGGMIADKFIGFRKSIFLGGVIMALGHFTMAFQHEITFYIALGLLIVGNGFFKPNIAALVGTLYTENDSRRDGGFTIFYMGVNVGAMLSPLMCGYLGHTYGWHYGFALAGFGMALGLVIFQLGLNKGVLGERGFQPKKYIGKKVGGLLEVDKFTYVTGFAVVPIFAMLVYSNDLKVFGKPLMASILIAALVIVLGIIIYRCSQVSRVEAQRLLVVAILAFFMMVFWSFFEQAGSSLTLFANENVNLIGISAAQTNAINPFYIMILALPFSMLWLYLTKFKMNPNTPIKSALGLGQLALGFFIFAYSANFMDAEGNVPFLFLLAGYLLLTTGELFIAPIGLSKATELSPAKYVSFMVAVFYMSSSFAHYVAGAIAKLTAKSGADHEGMEPGIMNDIVSAVTGFANGTTDSAVEGVQRLAVYTSVFAQIGVVAFCIALGAFMLSPAIKKMMHGIH